MFFKAAAAQKYQILNAQRNEELNLQLFCPWGRVCERERERERVRYNYMRNENQLQLQTFLITVP